MQFNVTKALIVSSLVLGAAGSVFATGSSGTSLLSSLKNSEVLKNVQKTIESKRSNNNGHGNSGGHTGGNHGGPSCVPPPPNCVPEPASMLALGVGAGVMALKRRRAAKNA